MTYKFKLSRRLAAAHRTGRGRLAPALLFLLAACGASPTGSSDSPSPATPGWLTIQLTSPNTDDGAIQLRVTGPGIDSVAPIGGLDGFGSVTAGAGDLVVTGTLGSGNIARVLVADVNQAALFSASVVAAAQLNSWALRPSTGGYSTVIVR